MRKQGLTKLMNRMKNFKGGDEDELPGLDMELWVLRVVEV